MFQYLISSLLINGLFAAEKWDYQNPNSWSNQFTTCAGSKQSPIDIRFEAQTSGLSIHSSDEQQEVSIFNSGHTIEIEFHDTESQTLITKTGEKFDLKQIHFHHRSEHKLYGHDYDLEMHLVHKNSNNGIAVLGVFFQVSDQGTGDNDSILHKVALNAIKSPNDKTKVNTTLNINNFISNDLNGLKDGWFAYDGSLTTPPCTEGVKWHVAKKILTVSKCDFESFKTIMGNNARPVQRIISSKCK